MKLMHYNISRTIIFLLLLVGALLQLKIALSEQSKFSRSQPSSSLWRQQINYALSRGQSKQVLRLLQRTLNRNPFYIPAWITMSELEMYRHQVDKSRKILAYIDGRMVDVAHWRWQKTMLAYQLGDKEMLARDLSYIVAEIPEHRQQALVLAASLWPDAEIRLQKIGTRNLLHLFRYSLWPERLEAALVYWPEARKLPELKLSDKLSFIELLRLDDKLKLARLLWREELKTDAVLYNGNFTAPPLKTAFGWRIGTPTGSSWELIPKTEHADSAFHLHFTGRENINYHHLLQYFIPVAAAAPDSAQATAGSGVRCTLSGKVRCDGLTTDQRPYFEVVGVNVKLPRARTEMFAANQDFTRFTLDFIVPPDCEQVYVRLRRNQSNDINCLIAGDIWINSLKISVDGLIND